MPLAALRQNSKCRSQTTAKTGSIGKPHYGVYPIVYIIAILLLCISTWALFLQSAMLTTLQLSPLRGEGGGRTLPDIDDALSRDYSNRCRLAFSKGRAKPIRRFIMWLHIPKTGTSFVNTIIRWGCPTAPPNVFVVPRKERPLAMSLQTDISFSWDWLFRSSEGGIWLQAHCTHRLASTSTRHARATIRYALNMHRPMLPSEAAYTVAMFRLPRQRIYSNYLHLAFHYNASRIAKRSLPQFLTRSQFWSQQAKLLLGRDYRDKRRVTMAEAERAAFTVMNKLSFVGLTEEFHLSVRLFHAIFGGVPHLLQFENVRPGITRYQSSESRSFSFRYDESPFGRWQDSADDVVYNAAKTRFWMDVCRLQSEIELDGLGAVYSPLCYTPLYTSLKLSEDTCEWKHFPPP